VIFCGISSFKVNNQPVTEEYFEQWSQNCDSQEANRKCYILMDQIKDNKLDSCEKTLGNLDGKNTIGNQLCDQAIRFLKNRNLDTSLGIQNLELVFSYSDCKKPWTSVTSDQIGELSLNEKLCCNADGSFYRCNGGSFNKSC